MYARARERVRGFTLIELLVVIAIIGLLSSVVLTSLNSARTKSQAAAAKQAAATLDNGLGADAVGWWNFDECSGVTVNDFSGTGANGTLAGSPTWQTNTPFGTGCSVYFNGSQEMTTVDKDALDIHTGSMTWALWFNSASAPSGTYALYRKSDSSNANGMIIEFSPTSLDCKIGYTPQVIAVVNTNYNDGQWHFISCVLDRSAGTLNFYVDGAQKASASAASLAGVDLNAASGVYIAGPYATPPASIDNVRVFASALTLAALDKLYAESVPPAFAISD